MPKDKRLYMTFPIDIHRHPKMLRLDPAVKWAFVEMNGEARIAGNDGRFSATDAEYLWSSDVLDALLSSHPTRPLVVREGTDYVIRDYAEHQMTVAAIEDLRAKRSRAGRQGAEATNGKRSANAGKSAASAEEIAASVRQNPAQGRQSSAEIESELKLETSDSDLTDLSALELNARELSSEEIAGCRKVLEKFGVESRDELAAVTLVELLMEASPRPVANVVGYIVRCVQRSPQKVKALAVEAERQTARVRLAVAS